MVKLNEKPVELNGKKWVFYGGVYQYGSLNGSLGILAKGPRDGHPVMVTENLVNYGRPTVGDYIAINPALEQKKKVFRNGRGCKKDILRRRRILFRHEKLASYFV